MEVNRESPITLNATALWRYRLRWIASVGASVKIRYCKFEKSDIVIINSENTVPRPVPTISCGVPAFPNLFAFWRRLKCLQPLLILLVSGHLSWGNEDVRVISLGSSTGVRTLSPGRWGQVGITIINESSEPASVRATVHLKTDPNLRFGREVWVPGRSKRTASIPVHLPADALGKGSFEVQGQVLSGATISAAQSGGSLLRIAPIGTTAFIDDELQESEPQLAQVPDLGRQAVLAMLADNNLFPALMTITDRLLPTTIEGWDSVRHVVVAGKRLKVEIAAAAALRQWVSEGGTMWLQMNRCDAETLSAIFGSTIEMVEVDRVPLTSVAVHRADLAEQSLSVEYEEPVELIRAQIRGGRVLHDVNGWPVAVLFKYGNGSVLLTLLDAAGWIRQRGQEDLVSNDPLWHTDYVPREPLSDLSRLIYGEKSDQTIDRELIANYVSDRIGYRIPPRWTVLSILSFFCIAILVCGLVLTARQRLEHLSWLAALAAVLATTLLIVIGRSHRGEVPPTIANFEFLNVSPQTGNYTASGGLAIFQPDQVRADFKSTGTRIDPQLPELSGEIREMIWTDGSDWQWNETRLPPGVMMLWSDSAGTLPLPVRAQASLGPLGLEGVFTSHGLHLLADDAYEPEPDSLDDGLILFPNSAPLAANLQLGGEFLSGEQDRLPEGQFTNRALLDDEQRRRQHLLDRWMTERRQQGTITQPTLLAWSKHATKNVTSEQPVQRIGTTLVAIPLEIGRPPVGTRVSIPSAMIRQQAVKGQSGASAAFNNRTESWTFPSTTTTQARIRFQMPQSALPLRLESATLVLDCHIPSRALEVFAVQGDQRVRVGSYMNASGSIETTISDPKWLELDSEGGLSLDISVGDTSSESEGSMAVQSGWSLRSSRLGVLGTTLSVESK